MMTPSDAVKTITALDDGALSADEEHDLLREALDTVVALRDEYAVCVSFDAGRTWETVCDSDGITWMTAGEAQEHHDKCRSDHRYAGARVQVAVRFVSAPTTWRPRV